jgi:apolipoprotein N-acyltransferase
MIAANIWIGERSFLVRALLSFCLGLLVAAAMAPLNLFFLLPVSFTGLIWILGHARTKKQAFFTGWWFAWGQFIAGLYWIGVAFTIDANAHAALIPLPVLALPAFLAIFSGLATLATYITSAKGLPRLFLFTAFWVIFEYVRGTIFTGFPWNLAGYTWTDILPILQSTAYIGIYGLTLLTVFVSTLPALIGEATLNRRTGFISLLCGLSLFAILFGLGQYRLSSSPTEVFENAKLRIVQPNIPQVDKWKSHLRLGHLRKLVELSNTENGFTPTHLIWPETAVPYYLSTTEKLRKQLAGIVPDDGTLITGAPRRDPTVNQYWNSMHVMDQRGNILATYDKQHLVPYGEYMPIRSFMQATGLTKLIPALDHMSDFATPDTDAPSVINVPGLPPARFLICYEIAFPWEISSDQKFDWILNVTNDGWFGNTSGPYQHFGKAKTRAVEQGVAVIRAANTGISAALDPYGRITKKIALNTAGITDVFIHKPTKIPTIYSKYGEFVPGLLVLGFLAIGFSFKRRNIL